MRWFFCVKNVKHTHMYYESDDYMNYDTLLSDYI